MINDYDDEEKALLDAVGPRLTLDNHLDNQCRILAEEIENHSKELIKRLRAEHERGKEQLRMAFEARMNMEEIAISSFAVSEARRLLFSALSGPYEGKSWTLDPFANGLCLLGRSTGKLCRESGISLPRDKEVSTSHAKIHVKKNKIYFMDAGSTNGSFIDGKLMEQETECEVRDGMQITIGSSTFLVKFIV